MKRMLIIQPHWPPSNLVGVHRVRLIANELHGLDWNATVLAVHEDDYEEELVPETTQLVAPEVEVIKVRARPAPTLFGRRIYGDIALRAWHPLMSRAGELLQTGDFDFVWVSLPPWYLALMGGPLLKKYGVPFGVDYRDPWIYNLAPEEKGINRAMFTLLAARVLEPLALRKASLITGVSEGYIQGVRDRYPKLLRDTRILTFQMGFARRDHEIPLPEYAVPFTPGKKTYVYAGAHWAMGAPLFRLFLKGLALAHRTQDLQECEFLFIGTGNPDLPRIQDQIEELGIAKIAREIPQRLSYLAVQKILRESDGTLVIGSTDAHYSASKIFQCLVTSPRLMGFFHEDSVGKGVLQECGADSFYVPFHSNRSQDEMLSDLSERLAAFVNPDTNWNANLTPLEAYTTRNNASAFLGEVNTIIPS